MWLDIFIAVGLLALTAIMGYLGVHVTLHPQTDPKQIMRFKYGFALCAAAAIGLIACQVVRSTKQQRENTALLQRIESNTQQQPKVTVENKIDTTPIAQILKPGLSTASQENNQSLKQRTLFLAHGIQKFSEETYPSNVVMNTNSGLTEEERQAQQKKYDSEIEARFHKKFYKEIRQIVAEYKAKGIDVMPTESLLSQQPKETRVGPWFVELIKDLRSLAGEIDDAGRLIQ